MTHQKACPFCSPHTDPHQNIIFENRTCYFLQHDKEQDVLEGCGVIVPKAHHSDAFHLTAEEWKDTYALLQKAKDYLDKKFSPDGYTLGWNVGEASNQTILHSHLHIIPRYNDEPYAGKGLRHWLKQPDNKRGVVNKLKTHSATVCFLSYCIFGGLLLTSRTSRRNTNTGIPTIRPQTPKKCSEKIRTMNV